MAHYYEHEDKNGDLIDLTAFCSDWCHQNWCRRNGMEYQGWNGCHESPYDYTCAECEQECEGTGNE